MNKLLPPVLIGFALDPVEVVAPVLSIHQPYAFAIVQRGKWIENRNYALPKQYRGPVFIHASKTTVTFRDVCVHENGCPPEIGDYVSGFGSDSFGAIVGTAWIVGNIHEDCERLSGLVGPNGKPIEDERTCETTRQLALSSEWFFGPWGWILDDMKPIVPVSFKGHQGFRPSVKESLSVRYFDMNFDVCQKQFRQKQFRKVH